MTQLQIFNYQGFKVRTIQRNGAPWFVLKDICTILAIGNTADVYNRLDEDERGVDRIDTPGGRQLMNVISESGLYNVILRSDKPEAKPFRKWVTSEVLPSIRKHGAYMTPQVLEEALLNPDTIIRLATKLKETQEENRKLEAKNSQLAVENTIMHPKAEYFDELVERNLLTNFRETAQELGVKEKQFVSFLLDKKYIYRDKKGKLMPYAQHKDNGLFDLKEVFNDKTNWSGTQTLITPKGRETFRLLYPKTVA